MKKLTLITLITLHVTLLHAAESVKVQNLVPVTPPLSAADMFYIIKSASDHTATMDNIADYVNLNIDAATGTIDYLISNGIQSGTAVITNVSATALSTTGNIVAGGQGRFAGLYATGKSTLADASVTAISGTNAIFSNIKGASIDATTGLKTPYLNTAKGNITAASFGGISTSGNAVVTGQGRFGTLYNAGASTFGGNMTLSGSAANIALGNNYLSGDGGDEGLFVDSNGNSYATSTSFLKLSSDNSYYGYIGGATNLANPNLRWQLGSYGEDFSYLIFDAYINPAVIAWKSSDVGSNAAIFKNTNKLIFCYDTGVAPGNTLNWKQGGYMDATNGTWIFSPGGSAVLTIQSASYEVTGAVGNSAAIFDAVAIRSGVFQDGIDVPYKTDIKTLDGKPVDLKSTDEIPTIYRYKINPEWFIEKKKHEVGRELLSATEAAEAKTQAADRSVVQEGFIREKLPERYHTPDGGINLSLIAQDALARAAEQEKRVDALEKRIELLEKK